MPEIVNAQELTPWLGGLGAPLQHSCLVWNLALLSAPFPVAVNNAIVWV